MGTRVPKSISEYPRFGVDFGVVCERCGRTAVFDPMAVVMFFHARKIPVTLPPDVSSFRCRCGSRRMRPIGVPTNRRVDRAARAARLFPLYVLDEEPK
jgi:hypothetical protein